MMDGFIECGVDDERCAHIPKEGRNAGRKFQMLRTCNFWSKD